MKIIFWGNGDFGYPIFTNLISLYPDMVLVSIPPKQSGRGRKIKPNKLIIAAQNHGLEIIEEDNLNTKKFHNRIQKASADLNIVADYGKIIPSSILKLYDGKFINIHPSLLPIYRGASPIQTALLNGDKTTGVTIQKMTQKLDAGDIILQESLKINEKDDYGTLSERLIDLSIKLLNNFLQEFVKTGDFSKITLHPQDEDKAVYCHKLKKQDFTTDWNESAYHIHNKIRSFSPKPGLKVFFRSKILKIYQAETVKTGLDNPGTIIEISKNKMIVAAAENGLSLLSVQPQDKNRMDIQNFINGYHPQTGEKLAGCFT